ncbi:MAG: aspartate/glutamate racemase family protein [Alphaproteobacteria bacterium]|nr:aspartate/glutamate racemase family protein [Alphaproteobacteria bacterium]
MTDIIKIKPKFGIDAGMGREAGGIMYNWFIKTDPAKVDQDAMPVMLGGDPRTPNRLNAINIERQRELLPHESPVPFIANSMRDMANAGCHFFMMACNTAHYFFDRIEQEIPDLPVLNMLEIATNSIKERSPDAKIGLLAMDEAVKAKVFDSYFSYIAPSEEGQEKVMMAVHGEKTGEFDVDGNPIRKPNGFKGGHQVRPKELLVEAASELANKGVDTIFMGCTEIPLARKELEGAFPNVAFIDPMEETAKKAVSISLETSKIVDAMYNEKKEVNNQIIMKIIKELI